MSTLDKTRLRDRPVPVLAATLFMLACTAYFLLPLWWMLVASSTTRGGLTDTSLWFHGQFELWTNIKNVVTYALTGAARGSDEHMLELLAPFAGHRGRVCGLLAAAGITAPKFGPRMPLRSFARF